jgi:hypothetical protein
MEMTFEKLNTIGELIKSEYQLETHVHPASPGLPLDVLVIYLGKDQKNTDQYLNLSYAPGMEEDLKGVRLLQLYGTMNVQVKKEQENELRMLISLLNENTAIGHFNLNLDGEIFYRYVFAENINEPIQTTVFEDVFLLFRSFYESFGAVIVQVADGEIDINTALKELGYLEL